MEAELEPSIREHADNLGMPDLILFTGDLTNRGAEAEFRQVDTFLDTLLGWLTDATGSNRHLLIVPVPGIHDLVRPEGRDLRNLRFLEHYGRGSDDADIARFQQDLWQARDASGLPLGHLHPEPLHALSARAHAPRALLERFRLRRRRPQPAQRTERR